MSETIELGDKVRDFVTRTEGIATARCEYLNGCVQFEIMARCKPDGDRIPGYWVDLAQIELLEKDAIETLIEDSTGPDWEGDDSDDGSTRPAGPGSTPPGLNHPK